MHITSMEEHLEESDSEVKDSNGDTDRFMSLSNRAGGDANDASLLEDEDYDIYEGYENDAYDLSDEQLTFYNSFDILVMSMNFWGLLDFACALIDIRVDRPLKDTMVIVILFVEGAGEVDQVIRRTVLAKMMDSKRYKTVMLKYSMDGKVGNTVNVAENVVEDSDSDVDVCHTPKRGLDRIHVSGGVTS
ncbi:hypothetical protein Tco_0045908 [Tanacetum coccineum]